MTDTTPSIVPIAPPTRWWHWATGGVGLVAVLAIAVTSVLPATLVAEKVNERLDEVQPAPYARTPASAESVNRRVVFGELPDGVARYDTAADFFFVTVTAPEQSLLSYFVGRGEPAFDLLTEEDKNGFQTPQQRQEFNLQAMRTAEQEAQYVALTTLGYDAEITPGEVVVAEVLCKVTADDGSCAESFPSDEQIDPADTIVEADGAPLGSVEDLVAVLADKEPGDTVDLLIDRPNAGRSEVTVELSAAPDDSDRTIVGFRPFDTRAITLPFEVDIDTGRIGGPSAGLAFTLSLIDELSPGELTGGEDIAVTGTIGLDGSVGAIGGLVQKVSAVHQHGVRVFLVPASQSELADPDQRRRLEEAGKGEVEIIPVATLAEALQVLERLGGDPLVPVAA